MKNNFIVDMDGTLYGFDNQSGKTFGESRFYAALKQRVVNFIGLRLDLTLQESQDALANVSEEYDGEISIGLEQKYDIDRYTYFASTWNVDPAQYISPTTKLKSCLAVIAGRATLLSAAPRVWIDRVLPYLGIVEVFEDRIYSGEPDIRKPSQAIFAKIIVEQLYTPADTISIGDQNYSDIVPAKALGLKTVLLGPAKQDADYRADDIYDAMAVLRREKLL